MACIDLRKAFDRISHSALFHALQEQGVSGVHHNVRYVVFLTDRVLPRVACSQFDMV